ncbi:hypothetical protein LSH36_141g08012 [Paralvinella palmiformis]|uniref:Gamma-glutamylcyclotransferase family protein n=1 Tax=Paralvinella palmiformis TaxID=53620 RepID=A0AAD9N9K2_9ANNE|nr:hypothetical protein LSH36_141g08012 [Paralvinella palmiformis]
MDGSHGSDSPRNLLFIYGTLKNGQQNHYHLLNPENGKSTFIAKGRTETAYPLIVATEWKIPFLLFAAEKGTIEFNVLILLQYEIHRPAEISASTKATSNLLLQMAFHSIGINYS